METLRTYLKQIGETQLAFCKRVGVAQSSMSQFATGGRRPTLEVAYKIEVATGGAVPMATWADPEWGKDILPAAKD